MGNMMKDFQVKFDIIKRMRWRIENIPNEILSYFQFLGSLFAEKIASSDS